MAVADGPTARAKLIAVSPAAERRGIRVGLSTAQAVAMAAQLLVRTVSAEARHAAQAALCDAAESFSPRVEEAGEGLVYLDLHGLRVLHESEAHIANALARRAEMLGLPAYVGIGSSKVAASLAARHGGGVAVIPEGEEWTYLAPMSVALLAPSPALAGTLQRWGIHTIGDLAALPANAVGNRLGPEGTLLLHRARGEDTQPLQPRPHPLQFEESSEFDYGIDTVEPLLFVLRALLDRLTARLAVRGLICGDLRLSLKLATRSREERTIVVAAPSNDIKALLALARLHLEAHPPAAAIEALQVRAVPEHLRAAQLDLFRPNGPAPAKLAVTLARLTAICGADHVGIPVVADSHRPDAYGVAPFLTVQESPPEPYGKTSRGRTSRRAERSRAPDLQSPTATLPLALRAFRPAQAVEVFCERDRPEFVRGEHLAGRVVHLAGPWRVHGDWWNDSSYSRDYYDAQLSDGGVYRLYRDAPTQRWFVDGCYD